MASKETYQLAWAQFGSFTTEFKEADALSLVGALQNEGNSRDSIVKALRLAGLAQASRSTGRMICLHCFEARAANISFAQTHLVSSCKKCPKEIRDRILPNVIDFKGQSLSQHKRKALASSVSEESSTISGALRSVGETDSFHPKRLPSGSIAHMMDRQLTDTQVAEIDRALASWLYVRGLPFNLLADKSLQQDVLSKLNSTYASRSSITPWTLRYQFLQEEYFQLNTRVQQTLRCAQNVCLISDGWSGLQKKHMLNVILATPLPFLVTNIYTSDSKVDGDYQAEKLAEVIKNVPSGVKVTALCTDNCSTNKKSWRELRKRFPGLLTYGCVCHVLQLLGNDISKMPDFAETLKKANRIVTSFRIHLRDWPLCENFNSISTPKNQA